MYGVRSLTIAIFSDYDHENDMPVIMDDPQSPSPAAKRVTRSHTTASPSTPSAGNVDCKFATQFRTKRMNFIYISAATREKTVS